MPTKFFHDDVIGPIELIKKRGLRSIRLRVDPHGIVKVSVPWLVSHQFAMNFVTSKQDWIIAQQQSIAPFAPYNGMPFGKNYTLYITELAQANRSRLDTNSLRLTVTGRLDTNDVVQMEFIRKAMTRALRFDAETSLVPRAMQLATQHNVKYRDIRIKQLTGRWGSCDSKGTIVLSLYLAQLPWELVDYVIIHELAHVNHMNHSPKFWTHLEKLCPDYKQHRKHLRTWQPRIYAE